MRLLLLLGLSLSLSTMSAGADTYTRQPKVDAQHYAFRLTLSDDADEVAGEATVDLRFVEDDVKEFSLDLASASGGKGMTVSGVTSGAAPVSYSHQAERLRVTLESPPKAGDRKTFTVRYGGTPAGGLRIGKNRHGERTFFSENWPDQARQWLPIIDHPYDKATSEFLVTAPARYQVVANGLLQEERDLGDGLRLTHWKQSIPIASWLNAIGVAQFASRHSGLVNGVPLQTWVFPRDRDAGVVAFEVPARAALEFYIERIGPYPYEKLANVQAAGLHGGTEHASAIFYGEDSVNGRPATALVAHEVAHQWFGDSVTERDWDDIWLSEGFATYFTLLFTEHSAGRDAFVAGLRRSRETVLAAEKKLPGVAVIHDNLSDMRKVLNPLVYQKGGWTLHMLRGLIGTDAFWAGIRDYYRRYRDGNVSTDDLQRAMEQSSGQDLSWFFRQWLNRAGSPSLEGNWHYDPTTNLVEVEFIQTQPGDPYRLPLEIGISVDGTPGTRVEKMEMTRRHQRFEIGADKEPSTVVVDPNVWTLMESRFVKR
jgi:aminopeptidase N